jgi:hypothetical protein
MTMELHLPASSSRRHEAARSRARLGGMVGCRPCRPAATPIVASVMTTSGGVVGLDVVGGIDGLRSARQDPKDLAIGALEARDPAIGPERQVENA